MVSQMMHEIGFVYCGDCKDYHDSSEFSLCLTPGDDLRLRCFRAIKIRLNSRRLKRVIKELSILKTEGGNLK